MDHPPAAFAENIRVEENLFQALFAISLSGVILFQPIYAGEELTDLAYVRLNLTAQRLLSLPERPETTLLGRLPKGVGSGLFAFYRAAFLTEQPSRRTVPYQADGQEVTFWVAAQRSGPYLIVSFTDTSDLADLRPAAEPFAPPAIYTKQRQHLSNVNAELVALTVELAATRQQLHELSHAFDARVQERTQGLQEANQRLSQVNRDLDYFIYSASHDLRAPIANLEGLLYAVDSTLPFDHPLRPDLQPLLTMMHGAVQRFHETITHLTDISRVSQEAARPAEPAQLADIVAGVQLDLTPLIATSQAQVFTELDGCSLLNLSSKHLRSIVFNLLSNALKYRHPARVPEVHIRCHTTQAAIELSVQDNGLGLTPEQQGHLFTLFHRLHHHVEGSGVGLYLIKKMVENAGGTLTVQSQAGVGSIFTVSIPV
ncbi:MAG: sensor histidine kinase [Janthinobacterium lividum]